MCVCRKTTDIYIWEAKTKNTWGIITSIKDITIVLSCQVLKQSFVPISKYFFAFSIYTRVKYMFYIFYVLYLLYNTKILRTIMQRRLTTTRLIVAIVSTTLEEVAIWVIWSWLLPEFGVNLPLAVLLGVMIAWAAFSTWLFIFTTLVLRKQALVGLPSMVGMVGRVTSRLSPEGQVRIKGELWHATSSEGDIEAGEEVVVVGERGLKLLVRKAGSTTIH
jgi:membrane protein implicated in regulation of membrane protease activity